MKILVAGEREQSVAGCWAIDSDGHKGRTTGAR
jgi:hypothetical protein